MPRTLSPIESLAAGAEREEVLRRVRRHPAWAEDLLQGLSDPRPAVRYGSSRVLRQLAEDHPEKLKPWFDELAAALAHPNKLLRCDIAAAVAAMAGVVSAPTMRALLPELARPLSGPELVPAANAAMALALAAERAPAFGPEVTEALLAAGRARLPTAECQRILAGKVIEAFDRIAPLAPADPRVPRFVKRHLRSSRPGTRKRAERWWKRHAPRT
ncbi:MAG: hypothetical protein ISR76_04945 [Planctomycetes bacterium]|nr:hypothetical protein [Planctomycetota bacterium]MBL7008323.1 hypothetical protein [Planctomycetota bacterium]